ncbi:MAG: SIS domain-containing protein [Sphaerochaetaceae bacterium]|jgi:D-sedoheptulose 7-phosphate isomerase|nr:SIS domain-containing protein [Sphaerochaetaceae bacterium]MDC7237241.1 SIS domain-containing protein [Sphaerochaetaceae bacterium]MDC7250349.1 SIS domain-containing protein [Sphaerochaetaceae bacterium]
MNDYIVDLIKRYPQLEVCKNSIQDSFNILDESAKNQKKILVCGNGGSSADSDHIVGELMKSFVKKRPIDSILKDNIEKIAPLEASNLTSKLQDAVSAINLSQHSALNTAFSNDVEPSLIFAQQIVGYGTKDDVLICISSSGSSKNVVLASIVAKAKNMKVIGLTGEKKGDVDQYCDVVIKVPEIETYKVQELHLPIYHTLCLMIENSLW